MGEMADYAEEAAMCPDDGLIEDEKLSKDADREMFGDDVENYGLEHVGCK